MECLVSFLAEVPFFLDGLDFVIVNLRARFYHHTNTVVVAGPFTSPMALWIDVVVAALRDFFRKQLTPTKKKVAQNSLHTRSAWNNQENKKYPTETHGY